MEDVRQFLLDLHDCWPGGDLERLSGFYHPEVILLPPDMGPPIRGRDAVVESYAQFLNAAQLERFEVSSLELFSFEPGTHMAHLEFDIAYELDNERYVEKGMEIYTVVENADIESGRRFSIVWRSQIVLDSRLEAKSETP